MNKSNKSFEVVFFLSLFIRFSLIIGTIPFHQRKYFPTFNVIWNGPGTYFTWSVEIENWPLKKSLDEPSAPLCFFSFETFPLLIVFIPIPTPPSLPSPHSPHPPTSAAYAGRLCRSCGLDPLQESRGLAPFPKHLSGVVRHGARGRPVQRRRHGLVRVRHPALRLRARHWSAANEERKKSEEWWWTEWHGWWNLVVP